MSSDQKDFNLDIPRDLSLLSSISRSPLSPEEYPELCPFISSERALDDVLSYIDGPDTKTIESNNEENVSIATEFLEDAEILLEDIRDVTVDAGHLIKKEVIEGIEVLTKPEDFDSDYSWIDGLWGLISAFTFVIDLSSDLFLSSTLNEDPLVEDWSRATLLTAVVPIIIQNLFSIYWYWFDERRETRDQAGQRSKTRPAVWLLRLVFHLTLLAPVLRQLEIIFYGVKSTKQTQKLSLPVELCMADEENVGKNTETKSKKFSLVPGKGKGRVNPHFANWNYRELWLHAEGDAAALDFIGTLLQDGPQIVLQLYVMIKTVPSFSEVAELSHTTVVQLGSISISLLTMAWTISGFVRAVRLPSSGLRALSPAEILLLTLSHFTSIAPQVFCFALLASKHLYLFLGFLLCHWLSATFTIFFQLMWLPVTAVRKATFAHDLKIGCLAWFDDMAFSAAFGIAFLFTFVDVDGAAPLLQAVLHCFGRLVEEIVFLSIWFLSTSRSTLWHWFPFLLVPLNFLLSLLFSVGFYLLLSRDIPGIGTGNSDYTKDKRKARPEEL